MPSDTSYQAEKVELALYIDNEADLYPQKLAIIKNMTRKIEAGAYDPKLAAKGWLHWVNAGAAKYCKEFRCEVIRTFPIAVRTAVAAEVAEREYEAIKSGEYGQLKKRSLAEEVKRAKAGLPALRRDAKKRLAKASKKKATRKRSRI